jgi:hypothetical protein
LIRPMYEVTDDSGFLALVDPVAYRSFVDRDWALDQLFGHFKEEISAGRLVMWGTGREDIWSVEVRFHRSSEIGFREFPTIVRASTDQLLLTNYESLSMAASYDDLALPENYQRNLLFSVTPGVYECRIVQRLDPGMTDPDLREGHADFFIELTSSGNCDEEKSVATAIPWSEF